MWGLVAWVVLGLIFLCADYVAEGRPTSEWFHRSLRRDQPFTQEQAWVCAGVRNVYDVPNFTELRDIKTNVRHGLLRIDWSTGAILPGRHSAFARSGNVVSYTWSDLSPPIGSIWGDADWADWLRITGGTAPPQPQRRRYPSPDPIRGI